ncbi:MAG TPA: hypothetical protein V6C88_11695 [Chroococcidiopsis sp.]
MALIQIEAHITVAQVILAAEQFSQQELDELIVNLLQLRVEHFGVASLPSVQALRQLSHDGSNHLVNASQGWEEEADALAIATDDVLQERYLHSAYPNVG